MVAASFGLTTFTQTRYDLQDQKVKNVREFFKNLYLELPDLRYIYQVSKEQELKLTNNKKKFDIREEYFVCYFCHFCGWFLMTHFL